MMMRNHTLKSLLLITTFLGSAPFAVAATETKIGVSAAVKGDVYVRGAQEENQRRAVVNEDVALGDEVDSRKKSALQILLLDETVFTVGSDCVLTIDEFVYDPSSKSGKMAASVAKGTFRFVTGRIGANDPQDVSITTPTATIGIRGTIIETTVGPNAIEIAKLAGLLGPDDDFDPEKATIVVLRGPGPANNTLNKDGSVDIDTGGGSQRLTVSASAVFIPFPGAEPTAPFAFTPEMDALIGQWLRSTPNPELVNLFNENGGGGSGSENSDQNTQTGQITPTGTRPTQQGNGDDTDPEGEVFPREDAEDEGMEMTMQDPVIPTGDLDDGMDDDMGDIASTGIFNNIGDEISTFELAATADGPVTFIQENVPLYEDTAGLPPFNANQSINVINGPFNDGDPQYGSYNFSVTVDPSNRTYDADFDFESGLLEITGAQNAKGSFGTGNAYLNPTTDAGVTLTETGACGVGECDTRIDFLIVDGDPLGGASHSFKFTEPDDEVEAITIRGAGSTSQRRVD